MAQTRKKVMSIMSCSEGLLIESLRLTMQEDFTPPRKKSTLDVPDSDDSRASENKHDDESVVEEATFTPNRIYQADWKVVTVQRWSTSTSLPKINRQIDSLQVQYLKCVAQCGIPRRRAERVLKTKETDWSY
jgi:hypothetical protein